MIEFDTTVRIDRTPSQVFAVLADFETYLARWAKGPLTAAKTHGDGGAGSRYTITARVGPVTVRSPYEVTSYETPRRLSGTGVAGPVRFREEYRLTDDGTATIVTQSIQATPRGPFRLAYGLLRRQLRGLIASDLKRLKDLVEAEIPDNGLSKPADKVAQINHICVIANERPQTTSRAERRGCAHRLGQTTITQSGTGAASPRIPSWVEPFTRRGPGRHLGPARVPHGLGALTGPGDGD